ncbi:serine/threonine protein kinase [Fictibacillus nanhaiensis]|uniref:serine/threonine protein kinase n=1 Tax=Fictibacillus nanhaiensis TaxID=742169 RepID=UPI001C964817|nr:serine/threonine-protein kinase [Fictibacillus nanhaiensis]MBY6036883.1 serine/threonine protein kinase [Fictibacillus nanhaiensis]
MITEFWKTLQRAIYDRPLPLNSLIHKRYRIEYVLGMGSYGITYLAQDEITKHTVVVKQLRPSKAKIEGGLASFEKEARILQELEHPQVPTLLQKFHDDDGHFIVMEWIQGDTFEDLIFRDHHQYSEKETIAILLKLLTIIDHFHQNGILHRDLRIPNIIERHGKLHVVDFGLACYLTDSEDSEPPDHPEKAHMRAVTVKSDIFALGHFALFLLYSSYVPQSKQERSWEEELDLSKSLQSVLRKMLQLDEPYHSIEEVRTALKQL